MIFVLLGTQPFPFERLIDELMELKQEGILGNQKIIIQAGVTSVMSTDATIETYDFLEKEQILSLITKADMIITHGGAGSIFDALALNKKIIALARSGKLHEHVDEHQAELVDILYKQKYILGCATLRESFALLPTFSFMPYHSSKEKIINTLSGWINEK